MPGELTIVGIGMIGASFAQAARTQFDRISALDPSRPHLDLALAQGTIDAAVEQVPAAARAVLLACPSDRIADWVEALAGHPATVFDAGSVKGAIIDELESRLGAVPANYVPAHPIAGRELSGPAAAEPELFVDRTVILTPTAATDPARLRAVREWWEAAGARIEMLDAGLHDRIYARTSHLPHLLAFAYLLGTEDADRGHTGGGFRDFSRIGGSDPDMWTGIFERNATALLAALDTFQANLADFRRSIEQGELDHCRALIAAARHQRELLD